jgi:hypothetical protein
LAQDGGRNEKEPIRWPGENPDGGVYIRRGIQPAENCEIEQFGGGRMSATPKWGSAACHEPHFGKSKQIEVLNLVLK